MNDICEGESYHVDGIDPFHKEGSFFDNFIGEPDILAPLYQLYDPAIAEDFINFPEHYTHAPSTSMLGEDAIRNTIARLTICLLIWSGMICLAIRIKHAGS